MEEFFMICTFIVVIIMPLYAVYTIVSSVIIASMDLEGYCAKHGIPLPKNYQQQYNTNTCMDEAYLLFMGDAVLRSNHPEATAAQQEYYNDNHEHHEAW